MQQQANTATACAEVSYPQTLALSAVALAVAVVARNVVPSSKRFSQHGYPRLSVHSRDQNPRSALELKLSKGRRAKDILQWFMPRPPLDPVRQLNLYLA